MKLFDYWRPQPMTKPESQSGDVGQDREFERKLKAYLQWRGMTKGRLSKKCRIPEAAASAIIKTGCCPAWLESRVLEGLTTTRRTILQINIPDAGPGGPAC